MPGAQDNATGLLLAVSNGAQGSWSKLLAAVYRELHVMAHHVMRRERPGQTLQTTALVHEAYLRLVPGKDARWQNRRHFFGAAARAMRQILAAEARKKKAAKRGKGRRPLSLFDSENAAQPPTLQGLPSEEIDALDRALDKLGADEQNSRLCTVVELRFFVGMTLEETADVLDVSVATVKRDWDFTRAWLHKEMTDDEKEQDGQPGKD